VPVAYRQQLSETEFLAAASDMVPLEIVARRLAVGSFLKRNPHLRTEDSKNPKRFHQLLVEFFLKTTGGEFGRFSMPNYAGQDKPIDDPLIVDPYAKQLVLAHPKAPDWETDTVDGEFPVIDASLVGCSSIEEADKLVRWVSLVLEKAWALLGVTWVDIKIEIDSLLRVSDVVDNDSWRLWKKGEQLDKQVFRDGGEGALDEVERKYGLVARLAEQLTLPRQALVIWTGSEKDEVSEIPKWPGVEQKRIVASGHKSTNQALCQLERLFHEYPQGGVIVAKVGRSNGLGPMLAAHSPWPVISIPADVKEHPENLWSSVAMPSYVPNLTAWPQGNAIGAVAQILAMTNPAVYAIDQMRREKLDGDYLA